MANNTDKGLEDKILANLVKPHNALELSKLIFNTHKEKTNVNRVLYALRDEGKVSMIPGTPPIWQIK